MNKEHTIYVVNGNQAIYKAWDDVVCGGTLQSQKCFAEKKP